MQRGITTPKYYDFRAYTQVTSDGLNQGFVLARHHMLVGTVQTRFRAGKPQARSEEALMLALAQLDHLAAIASREDLPMQSDALPMQPGERSI